jgi:hypothetical protein
MLNAFLPALEPMITEAAPRGNFGRTSLPVIEDWQCFKAMSQPEMLNKVVLSSESSRRFRAWTVVMFVEMLRGWLQTIANTQCCLPVNGEIGEPPCGAHTQPSKFK